MATRDYLYDPRAPSALQKIVHFRIERLGGDSRKVLQNAAIIGTGFEYKILRELLGPVSKKLLDTCLKELQRHDFIIERSKFPKKILEFRNSAIQRIIYDTIPLNRRVSLHGRLASLIESTNSDFEEENLALIATNYLRSDRNEQAIKFAFLYAKSLFKNYRLTQALDIFIKTCDIIDACNLSHEYLEIKKEIFRYKWEIYLLLGSYDLSLASLNFLTTLLKESDFSQALDIKRMAAEILIEQGQFKKAEEMLYQIIETSRSKGLNNILVQALRALGFINIFREKIEATKEICEEGLFLCEEEDVKNRSQFLIYLGFTEYYKSRYIQALAYFNKALDQLKSNEDKALIGKVWCNIGMVHFKSGRFESALENYLKSLEVLSKIEYQRASSITRMNLAVLYDHMGNYKKALYEYNVVLKTAEEMGNSRLLMMVQGNIGEVYTRLGEYDLSRKYLKEALEFAGRIGSSFWKAAVLINLGINHAETDNSVQARSLLKEGIEIARTIGENEKEIEAKYELVKLDDNLPRALENARALYYTVIEKREFGVSENLSLKILLLLGNLELKAGKGEKGIRYLEEGHSKALSLNNSELIFRYLLDIAQFYEGTENLKEAKSCLKKCKKVFSELIASIPYDNQNTFRQKKAVKRFENLLTKYKIKDNPYEENKNEMFEKDY